MKPRRYEQLIRALLARRADTEARGNTSFPASFKEIEGWAGTPLPRSAYKHRAWWSNNTGNYSNTLKPWDMANLTVTEVDMEAQTLLFRLSNTDAEQARKNRPTLDWTTAPQPGMQEAAQPYRTRDKHPLRGALKGTIRIADDLDLTAPADPEWADRI